MLSLHILSEHQIKDNFYLANYKRLMQQYLTQEKLRY